MALKLQVPWRREPLSVQSTGLDRVIRVIRESGSPNVVQCDNGDVLVKDFFGVNNRVHDVSRYRIDCNRQPVRHFDVPESRLQTQLRSIMLLVESPHIDEYQFGNINFPIAPANGATGKNIDRCLGHVLSRTDEQLIEPGYHVIISNPIQFQTSLKSIHRNGLEGEWNELKDNVWKALWNDGEGGEGVPGYIKLCFRTRLNTYRPSLIINGCTDLLTEHVSNFVIEELQNVAELHNVHLYNVGHPSSWRRSDCSGICLTPIFPLANHNNDN